MNSDPEVQLMTCVGGGKVLYGPGHDTPLEQPPSDAEARMFKGCAMLLFDLTEEQAEIFARGKK
jgi:hypothetical protein